MRSIIILALFLLSSCASGLQTQPSARRSQSTTVLFVVDGLGARTLQMSLPRMPAVRSYFLKGEKRFPLARASFPTLTYPNLASILTATVPGDQPITSNHMIIEGEEHDFESHRFHKELRELVEPRSVFQNLNGDETASFSYVLGRSATHHMEAGLQEGLEYKRHEYEELDRRLLDNLRDFLSERPDPSYWPRFIYVHLVGVDGIAHQHGPYSEESRDYLRWLDGRMQPVLQLLKRAEGRQPIYSYLTADHGFEATPNRLKTHRWIQRHYPEVRFTNESRFLGLYFPPELPAARKQALFKELQRSEGIAFVARRENDRVEIETATRRWSYRYGPALCARFTYSLAPVEKEWLRVTSSYRCPSEFTTDGRYPFLVEDLSHYFSVPHHPDALVIAGPKFTFGKDKGSHGGPSREEVMVPLLMRNSRSLALPKTSDILRPLFGPVGQSL